MEFTTSYQNSVPADVLARYTFVEVRNAAAVLRAAAPEEFDSLVRALRTFALRDEHLLQAGGNEGLIAKELNASLRQDGWREARADVETRLMLKLKGSGSVAETMTETEQLSTGYLIDNFRERVAVDVEWNAKDGNLDRDIAAYRALYDLALIDGAVIITREHASMREYARELALKNGRSEEKAKRLLNTTTTTNLEKAAPRLSRGDAGGCPVLLVAICPATATAATR